MNLPNSGFVSHHRGSSVAAVNNCEKEITGQKRYGVSAIRTSFALSGLCRGIAPTPERCFPRFCTPGFRCIGSNVPPRGREFLLRRVKSLRGIRCLVHQYTIGHRLSDNRLRRLEDIGHCWLLVDPCFYTEGFCRWYLCGFDYLAACCCWMMRTRRLKT